MRSVVAVIFLAAATCASTWAQPAAKHAVQVNNLMTWDRDLPGASSWINILSTVIKTSSQKDLILGVSLETSLFTETFVSSKGGTQETADATAGIEVRVCIDNTTSPNGGACDGAGGLAGYVSAQPGVVMFDKRRQLLTAKFAGILSACTGDRDGDGIPNEVPDDCIITAEELSLLLDTTAAHHFNFVLDDIGVGTHNVKVQARISITENASSANARADAKALVGKGSVAVEEIRLVKGVDITL